MENVWAQYSPKVAGVWKLVSFEIWQYNGDDKQVIGKPHGDEPLGRIVITPGGFLSAQLTQPQVMNRQDNVKRLAETSDAEMARVFKGISMYCGSVELFRNEDDELLLTTTITIASDPYRVGGVQQRLTRFLDEDGKSYMLLSPRKDKYIGEVEGIEALLKWEKIE